MNNKGRKTRQKIDFKFTFHVTKVPHSGWEKLYVSLESIETGKTTAKTAKSTVQNGTCRFPDAIIESTRLVHDTRNNFYDSKLYKFIVGMSSTRVLGEITLNLAEYVTATSPTSYGFPLKNCSAGTVLHMKLHCLASGELSGELEPTKDSQTEHISEDELDDSSLHLPPPTPSKQEKVLSRYNSDSSEASTPLKGLYSPENSFNSKPNGRVRTSLDKLGKPARLSLPSSLDKQDCETLKQQISDQTRILMQKDEEIALIGEEVTSLRKQIESLTLSEVKLKEEVEQISLQKRELEYSRNQDLEDSRNTIQELENILAHEKGITARNIQKLEQKLEYKQEELNKFEERVKEYATKLTEEQEVSIKNMETMHNLEANLEKTQEEIKKFEEMVENYESKLNKEHKVSEDNIRMVHDLEQKLENKQQEVNKLEDTLKLHANVDPEEATHLRKEVEELEVDIKELTDENMDLIFKLNMANKELSRFSGVSDYLGLSSLEDKVNSFKQEHESFKELNSELNDAKSQLEHQVNSLVDEVNTLKSELKASRNMHAMDREAFSGREMRLREKTEVLEEKYSANVLLVSSLESELDTVKKDYSENLRRNQELTGLAYRLAELEGENLTIKTNLKKCETELELAKGELKLKVAKLTDAESLISMLESANYELEHGLSECKNREALHGSRIVELEVQVSTVTKELENLQLKKQEHEQRVDKLELEKYELENMLKASKEENILLKENIEGISGNLAEANAQLDIEVNSRNTLEKRVQELDLKVNVDEEKLKSVEEDNWQLTERVAGLEAQLSYVDTCRGELEQKLQSVLEEQEKLKSEEASVRKGYEECKTVRMLVESKLTDVERELAQRNLELENVTSRFEDLSQRAQAEKSRLQEELRRLMDENSDDKERFNVITERLQWEEIRNELEQNIKTLENSLKDAEYSMETSKARFQDQIESFRKRELDFTLKLEDADAKLTDMHKVVEENNELRRKMAEKNALEAAMQKLQEENQTKVGELEEVKVKAEQMEAEKSAHRALEVEQRCESIKLRRQNSEMKQKMSESEAEKEELKKRIEILETDRKRRGGSDENGKVPTGNGVLAKSMSKGNVRVNTQDRDKIKSLEMELKLKSAECESLKREARQKEKKVEVVGNEQQREELSKLKQELTAKANSQELLQKELQRVKQANLQLEEKLSRFKEMSKSGNTFERVSNLETELAEALESNNMYKEQLRSAFAKQQNVHAAALQNLGDVSQVVSDLKGYKRKSIELETELCEMRERYLTMSLRFAQVEEEREELVMAVRSLRNGRKPSF